MGYNLSTGEYKMSDLMIKLQSEKKAGFELQKRKHDDWTDNYDLDRGKVKINRLTQRQAVNIPLMKETRKTMLSRIDDPPNVEWKELGGDEGKQLIFQEMWNVHVKENNLELQDILDKNNVLLYGRSTKWLNINDGGITCSVSDPYDVLFDPLMNPWEIESARYIVRQNIFRSVRDILADEKYSKEGKDDLRMWADSPDALIQSAKNKEEWDKKMQRLKDMGVTSWQFSMFAAGDTIVHLTEHFTKIWDVKKQKFVKRVVVYANDLIELYNETLEDCLGVDFWPCVTWAEDPQLLDIYPDAVADLVRTPNKILNVWYSQMIENRTLKNFQMHWVSATGNYQPQTFTPGPGMQLPAPPLSATGRISDVIQPVEVSGLDDTLEAINALTQIVERATGATAIEKGEPEAGQQTLGEIEILVGKANERATAMAKFYRLAWYEYAWKWAELMHANSPKLKKLYRQGRSGKMYEKQVMASDWKSKSGFEPLVRSTSEQESETMKGVQKFMFVMSQFPNNTALRKIAQKRELELLDLTPEELHQVEEAEKQSEMMMQQQQMGPQAAPQQDLMSEVQGKLQQLQTANA